MQFIKRMIFPSFSVTKYAQFVWYCRKKLLFQTLTLEFDLHGSFVKFDHSQNRIPYGV